MFACIDEALETLTQEEEELILMNVRLLNKLTIDFAFLQSTFGDMVMKCIFSVKSENDVR